LNSASSKAVEPDMDHDEREALRGDGPDPDDQAVLAALARVSEALAELGTTIAVGRYAGGADEPRTNNFGPTGGENPGHE
jgi:hypothetical protein